MNLIKFYNNAKQKVIDAGYGNEIERYWQISFENIDSEQFLRNYVWVVLNAGMKWEIAKRIFENYPNIKINHRGKKAAIDLAVRKHQVWLDILRSIKSDEDKIEYLKSLPYIGSISCHHLARNIGIDTVKDDRHLRRVADQFGYSTPIDMCKEIQKGTNERLGVIDIVLWRYSKLKSHSS
ncbi:Uncharacterised protein [uncultured archaeon]|nr:Uncharacterised protein [uncultured archaeon]